MGLSFTLSLSTDDALDQLKRNRFAAIISDMGRREGPREGYELLAKVRETDERTPFFVYAGSKSAELEREALSLGAQGNTNDPQELFRMVMRAVVARRANETDASRAHSQ
jgi:DNA-binding NtrC family response regulator